MTSSLTVWRHIWHHVNSLVFTIISISCWRPAVMLYSASNGEQKTEQAYYRRITSVTNESCNNKLHVAGTRVFEAENWQWTIVVITWWGRTWKVCANLTLLLTCWSLGDQCAIFNHAIFNVILLVGILNFWFSCHIIRNECHSPQDIIKSALM